MIVHGELVDIVLSTWSDAEIREEARRLNLASSLPGSIATHRQLADEFVALLQRRGATNEAFFERLLKDSAREHHLAVETMAAAQGITLRHKHTLPNAANQALRQPLAAVLAVALLLVVAAASTCSEAPQENTGQASLNVSSTRKVPTVSKDLTWSGKEQSIGLIHRDWPDEWMGIVATYVRREHAFSFAVSPNLTDDVPRLDGKRFEILLESGVHQYETNGRYNSVDRSSGSPLGTDYVGFTLSSALTCQLLTEATTTGWMSVRLAQNEVVFHILDLAGALSTLRETCTP